VIVGGGFTGLWAAIRAKEDDPSRDVVLVEGESIAFGGSGRNGGFCDATLTHGLPNGLDRFPEEIQVIERMAEESFAGLKATIERFGIDCDWNASGSLGVAREEHELAWLSEAVETGARFGHDIELLDRDAVRAASGSTRARRRRRWMPTTTAWSCGRRTRGSARTARSWARTRTRRSRARSAATWCRCTTTS
jgi:glycine/D-amino acid oxidase-like deaminating enzyme